MRRKKAVHLGSLTAVNNIFVGIEDFKIIDLTNFPENGLNYWPQNGYKKKLPLRALLKTPPLPAS